MMQKGFKLAILAGALIILAAAVFYFLKNKDTRMKTLKVGAAKVKVEIADNPVEQARGLSGRQSLCADCGMLFVFPKERELTFWMKGMRFPLDMIFIRDGRVVKIAANVPAPRETDFMPAIVQSGGVADMVLEVNAGFASEKGVKISDPIR